MLQGLIIIIIINMLWAPPAFLGLSRTNFVTRLPQAACLPAFGIGTAIYAVHRRTCCFICCMSCCCCLCCRFVDDYLRMVHACAERDRQQVVDMSVQLGFLTGRLVV
jgi:hypothetical protein